MTSEPSFVVFSGGSACNHIVNAFQAITPSVCYALGISDNGGSTSELLRVLGGPSIGDLRSRLTRLINIDGHNVEEQSAIKELLSYRLSSMGDEHAVRDEWSLIVEGRHKLWEKIPIEKKETIRGFLVLFNFEILKRAHKHFNFCHGSIGNFFLTGARLFFGSLEAAIFLFSSITAIREPTYVLPIINTNHTAAIAALLEDGQILHGQCEISHPGQKKVDTRSMNPIDAFSRLALPNSPLLDNDDVMNGNLIFSKTTEEKLPAPISRIYYINEYGQEIYPLPNPKILDHLKNRTELVYSIGSLYTSILPCLILRKVGYAISHSPSLHHKILILNGSTDRETDGYTALDFIRTITDALNESQLIDARRQFYDTHIEEDALCQNGHLSNDSYRRPVADFNSKRWPLTPSLGQLQISRAPSIVGGQEEGYPSNGYFNFSQSFDIPSELIPDQPPSTYITHLIYLSNSLIPVDVEAIESLGIQCMVVEADPTSEEPKYNSASLQAALERIIKT
ncbi:uncharacterized protein BX663DRAFT_494478 [Cokeromyces recurvatus]|uniref:uncharacterized protein n=1 Tax=Cokeromyces recurvatus TaxID=90255 RepID=UPI00222077A4|nr:uncharacterized protein BX663DRAFT_494478 [Cokeromyces recurvatus]KAI7907005.1 hypothetical protein BX663DRAFT_494478 [Cokeromyces recurvatus]